LSTASLSPATLDDLLKVREKAELIGGRIVYFMPAGEQHGEVVGEIYARLRELVKQSGTGRAFGDNVGFALPAPLPSGRLSFCPDAAYMDTPRTGSNRKFVPGPPTFAVEVRSESDVGPKAERDMAEKRSDYFQAGTLAVWDVDPIANVVTVYRHNDPSTPTVFRAGDTADAEPAVPGWRVPVAELFPPAN
jgi:Uma2 family endonuclease